MRPSSIRREISAINALLAHARKRPWELGPNDLEAWREHQRQERKADEATLRLNHRAALCFLDYLCQADVPKRESNEEGGSTQPPLEQPDAAHRASAEDGCLRHHEQSPSATASANAPLGRSEAVDRAARKSPRKSTCAPAKGSTKGYCRTLSAEQIRRIRELLASCRKEPD